MSATNATSNYELPIFLATDKPAWLTDWNGAMTAIDTAIHAAQAAADGAQTTASAATVDIATINASLSTITGNITSLTTAVNGNTAAINTINSLIGNGEPTTTDKTLIGAINEIYAMITGGGQTEIQAANVSYDNTTSGLTASSVQAAIDEVSDADGISYDNTTSGLSATDVQAAIDEVAGLIPGATSIEILDFTLPASITANTPVDVADLPSGYTHSNCMFVGYSVYDSADNLSYTGSGVVPYGFAMGNDDKIKIFASSVPSWLPNAAAKVMLAKV